MFLFKVHVVSVVIDQSHQLMNHFLFVTGYAPHSSFPPTTAPLQTLHMDVWGPTRVSGQDRERYFLLVVDGYTRYATVFPLRSRGEVPDVLIPWIHAVRLQLREQFREDLPVLRLHSDRGGEFYSDLLWEFCLSEGILQSFTLPASVHQNGAAERRIGLVMVQAAAPHFLWSFAVRYAAHQLNLWPRVSVPETSPMLRWTGKVGDASVFQFYHPTLRRVLPSHDVTFDESVPLYRLFSYRTAPLPPPPTLFLAPGPPPVDPLPPQGLAPSGVSQVDPLPLVVPVKVAVDSGAARGVASGGAARGAASGGAVSKGAVTGGAASGGDEPASAEPGGAEPEGAELGGAESEGAESGGAETEGVEPGGAEPEGAEPGGAESEGAESGDAEPRGTASTRGPAGALPRRTLVRSGVAGAGGSAVGGTGAGGAGAAGFGGARTSGTRAAGAGGVGGAGAGDPGARGTGAGDLGAGGTGAGGAGAGGAGVGDPGAGGPAAEGTGATSPGGAGVTAGAGGPGGAGAAGWGGACTRGTIAAGAGLEVLELETVELEALALEALELEALELEALELETLELEALELETLELEALELETLELEALVLSTLELEVLALGVLHLAVLVLEALCSGDRFSFRRHRRLCRHLTRSFAWFLSQPQLQPDSPLPAPSPYGEQTDSLTERREPESHPASLVRAVRTGRRVPCPRPPSVSGTHIMALRPSSVPLSVLLPSPLASSLPDVPDPESDLARAASPTFPRLLATVVTDPSFECNVASALVAELVDFAATCRLDYASSLVAEFESDCPPSVGGECALGTDVLEDRQEDFECLAAVVPHLVAMLLAREGEPVAPDIPTPRSYAEVITGPYSFLWQAAMDTHIASWKSTTTYIDAVPPSGANIVDDMWIFRHSFLTRQPARGDLAAPPTWLHWVVSCRYPEEPLAASLRSGPFSASASPQSTPVPTGHSLSALPSDESVESSGPYPEFVSCLISSCEAEIYAGAMAAQELRWLTYMLTDLGERPRSSPVLYVDNNAMIALCQEHRLEHRTKHIALRYFLARELQQRGQFRLAYMTTRANIADIFSKTLQFGDHQRFCIVLGLVPTLPHLLTA
ncbi:unnamed protein product [Closterium sp. NIES-53]